MNDSGGNSEKRQGTGEETNIGTAVIRVVDLSPVTEVAEIDVVIK